VVILRLPSSVVGRPLEFGQLPAPVHLLDPYCFTQLLRGFVLCGLLAWLAPRLTAVWQLWLAVSLEALWEVVENSDSEQRRGAAPTW
jgi:Protein of unknown function (DUF2585)